MEKEKLLNVIGLMSGTSLDGVDLVLVTFYKDHSFELKYADTYEYSDDWLATLKSVSEIPKGHQKLKELDVLLGKYYADLILKFIKTYHLKDVHLISSHGHTVHHQPDIGYTLQVGCGKEICKCTNIKTVYNFREQDVLYGGQGAPLVPIGDELLFSTYDYCLNLGGFSNVSYQEKGVRKAFDICPVNTILNFYAEKLGHSYDAFGEIAASGCINHCLLKELNDVPFYVLETPKSLGIEFLKTEIHPIILKQNLSEKDVLRTFVEHIACQISNKIKKGTVLVTGGGAFNDFLMVRLQAVSPNVKFIIPSKLLINYKEALIFALLGKLKIENKPNCLASVTGAFKNHSSGIIANKL